MTVAPWTRAPAASSWTTLQLPVSDAASASRHRSAPAGATWWATALRTVLLLLLAALLGGCGVMAMFRGEQEVEEPEEKLVPIYRLDVEAPGDVRTLLTSYLDLARFQSTPESYEVTPQELDRLISGAPAQARALLETSGYFNADVRAERLPDDGELPRVLVTVDPGPRTEVASLSLDATGALREGLGQNNPNAIAAWTAMHGSWPLPPGRPWTQAAWTSAKNATIARLRSAGYASAQWGTTLATVDAPKNRVALELTAESGPLYLLGEITVEGLQRHGPESVTRLRSFSPGTPYTERVLLDYQERLRKVGLFESAIVELDPSVETSQAAPVTVRVRELQLQQATVGVGVSDATGPRITLEHTHRRVFGQPWVARNRLELGRDQQSVESEFLSHPREGGHRNLLSGSVLQEEAAGTEVQSARVRAGRVRDTERIERLVFAEYVAARSTNAAESSFNRAISGNYHWIWRDVDSVLLPTTGRTINLQGAVGQALSGAVDSSGPFGRAYGRLTVYRPLGNRWYGNARIEAAQVFARGNVGVPETLLFRAGGDDSVRGYGYRTLGPTRDGVVTSGRVLLTGSVEAARPFLERLPDLWGAVFVDAGQAADRWSELNPDFGYGVGLRYRSPVGPLRLDLAYGQAVQRFRLHLSVGIAF